MIDATISQIRNSKTEFASVKVDSLKLTANVSRHFHLILTLAAQPTVQLRLSLNPKKRDVSRALTAASPAKRHLNVQAAEVDLTTT